MENKSSAPPTPAEANLKAALEAADDWAHEHPNETQVIADIESEAQFVKDYCTYVPVPQQNRLQQSANALNGLIN